MLRGSSVFCLALLFFGLGACAPVVVGRTPTPTPVGQTEVSVLGSYPFGLTALPVCEFCEYIGPAYWPLPLPLTVHIAYGRAENLETNVGVMLLPDPSLPGIGVRYGAKERFQQEPVALAFDYGGSLYLSNVGLDAGLLGGVPLGEAELYGALRGFGNVYWGTPPNLAAALTFGAAVPVAEGGRVLLELTLLASGYNGVESVEDAQPVGFSLVPALGFSF